MKISRSLIAALTLFSSAGVSHARFYDIVAGGSSSTAGTLLSTLVNTTCTGATATNTTVYLLNGGVTNFAVVCPSDKVGSSNTLRFFYDSRGGSFHGISGVSNANIAVSGVQRVDLGTCTAIANKIIGTKTVAAQVCTGSLTTRERPVIGNIDVEPALFKGANLPAASATPLQANVVQPDPSFGVIFGIAASKKLIDDLRVKQGMTNCVGKPIHAFLYGSPDTSYRAAMAEVEACAPSISKAEVASIYAAHTGTGATDPVTAMGLTAGVPFQAWGRLPGSGARASFSAVFLNYLCSPRGLTHAAASSIVKLADSSSTLIANIPSTTEYRIGYASIETLDMRVSIRGDLYSYPGWLKVDGVYPSKANAIAGRYTWVSEQLMTKQTGLSGVPLAVYYDIAADVKKPTTFAKLGPASVGTVALFGIAYRPDWPPMPGQDSDYLATEIANFDAQATYSRTLGNSCTPPLAQ